MKKQFKKWTFRLIVTGVFLFGLLVTFMLNPILLYANKTAIGNYSIYHNKPLDKNFQHRLEQSNSIIRSSELYDPELKMDICLKDGSKYPGLIEMVMGKDLLSSFYNKIIFTGDVVNYDCNYKATLNILQDKIHRLKTCKPALIRSYGQNKEMKMAG